MDTSRDWRRIGVGLSIGWALVICSLIAYEYFIAKQSDGHWFVTYVYGSVPEPTRPGLILDVPSLRIGRSILAIGAPVVLIWAAVQLLGLQVERKPVRTLSVKIYCAGLVCGLVVGFAIAYLFAHRYRIDHIVGGRLPIRVDTWTGKSWIGEPRAGVWRWVPMEERAQ